MKHWIVLASFLLCIFLPACDAHAQKTISFWTSEVERDRIAVQNNIASEFTRKTGIVVRVIPVEENLLAERVAAAFAARSLPDVLFHPLDFTIGWAEAGILDG
ncbi:MAG: hypothetical protein RBT20_10695, partial [Syntrophales bacterium]|nr:hypothetical protein [Syntrophales bacterium]